MSKLLASLLVVFVIAAPETLRADQNNTALNELFSRLQLTENPGEAAKIEHAIWSIWIHHDDALVVARMSLGIRAMNAGLLQRSLRTFDKIVQIAPSFAEGWNKRATVYYLMGNFEASVHDIQKTLLLEPRHFGALSGMGLIYSALGRDQAALKVWEKALSIHPRLEGIKARVEELREKLKGEQT